MKSKYISARFLPQCFFEKLEKLYCLISKAVLWKNNRRKPDFLHCKEKIQIFSKFLSLAYKNGSLLLFSDFANFQFFPAFCLKRAFIVFKNNKNSKNNKKSRLSA